MFFLHATGERAVNHVWLSFFPPSVSLPHVPYAWVDSPGVFTNALNACHAMHHPASSHRPFLIGIPLLSLWSSWTSDAGASDTSSVTARNKAQEFSWRDWPCYNVWRLKLSSILTFYSQTHKLIEVDVAGGPTWHHQVEKSMFALDVWAEIQKINLDLG